MANKIDTNQELIVPVPYRLVRSVPPTALRVWIALRTLAPDGFFSKDMITVEAYWSDLAKMADVSNSTCRSAMSNLRHAGYADWESPLPNRATKTVFHAHWRPMDP